jgi:hypothetical protein
MRQERQDLDNRVTVGRHCDLPYLQELVALHCVRILATFIPQLARLRKEITNLFKSDARPKFGFACAPASCNLLELMQNTRRKPRV